MRALILHAQDRLTTLVLGFGAADLAWAVLFAVAYVRGRQGARPR